MAVNRWCDSVSSSNLLIERERERGKGWVVVEGMGGLKDKHYGMAIVSYVTCRGTDFGGAYLQGSVA